MIAEGNLIGYVNNEDIVDSTIIVRVTPGDFSTMVEGTVRNISPNAGKPI